MAIKQLITKEVQKNEIKKFLEAHDKWRKATTMKSAKTYSDRMVRIMERANKQGWLTALGFALDRRLIQIRKQNEKLVAK